MTGFAEVNFNVAIDDPDTFTGSAICAVVFPAASFFIFCSRIEKKVSCISSFVFSSCFSVLVKQFVNMFSDYFFSMICFYPKG